MSDPCKSASFLSSRFTRYAVRGTRYAVRGTQWVRYTGEEVVLIHVHAGYEGVQFDMEFTSLNFFV